MSDDVVVTKKRGGCLKWIAIIAAVLIGLAVLGAIFGEPDGASGPTGSDAAKSGDVGAKPARQVTAVELFEAYDANEAAAQEEYGDQQLLVSGTVSKIDLDFMNKPVVLMQTGNEFQDAQAQLVEASQPLAKTLSKGQQITLLCGSVGEVVGTPMLRDCAIQ